MIRQISPNLFEIPLGAVNAHLIQMSNDLILIDTGSAGDETKISTALNQIGFSLSDLTHIIVTHCHADHAGSLAALQQVTHISTMMHAADAELVEKGEAKRPLTSAPGLLNKLLFPLFIAPAPASIVPSQVDRLVADGEWLSLAGGMRVIHTPGHSAGQISLLWEPEGVLFAADAVTNQPLLAYHIGYEDFAMGQRSAAKLADLSFETAVFGHGKPLIGRASQKFKQKFGRVRDAQAAVFLKGE